MMSSACTPGISKVISDDMCIACGACIEVCPPQVIQAAYSDERGCHEVRIADSEACASCAAPCDSVCPSITVDYPALLGPHNRASRIGPVEAIFVGYSPTHRTDGVSSSGGVLRALIAQALGANMPVVCLGEDNAGGYSVQWLTDSSDLSRIPGSIYHSVPFTNAIRLLRESPRPCVLVATPCQIEGIQKYVQCVEPSLAQKVALTLGLICGWMYSDHSLKAFAAYKQIRMPLKKVAYRGENEVGFLKIETTNATHKYDRRNFRTFRERLDYRASFSSPANRLRCRVCQNHVNVLADVAVGDAWLRRKRGEKLSIVIARSKRGLEALLNLEQRGHVCLEEASEADVIESQSSDLVLGTTARALAAYLARLSYQSPQFRFDGDGQQGTGQERSFNAELAMRRVLRAGQYMRFRRMYFLNNVYKLVRQHLASRKWLVRILRGHK